MEALSEVRAANAGEKRKRSEDFEDVEVGCCPELGSWEAAWAGSPTPAPQTPEDFWSPSPERLSVSLERTPERPESEPAPSERKLVTPERRPAASPAEKPRRKKLRLDPHPATVYSVVIRAMGGRASEHVQHNYDLSSAVEGSWSRNYRVEQAMSVAVAANLGDFRLAAMLAAARPPALELTQGALFETWQSEAVEAVLGALKHWKAKLADPSWLALLSSLQEILQHGGPDTRNRRIARSRAAVVIEALRSAGQSDLAARLERVL